MVRVPIQGIDFSTENTLADVITTLEVLGTEDVGKSTDQVSTGSIVDLIVVPETGTLTQESIGTSITSLVEITIETESISQDSIGTSITSIITTTTVIT